MNDKVGRITFGPGDTKTTTASNIIDGSNAYDRMRSERDHYRDKYHEAQVRVAELESALQRIAEDYRDYDSHELADIAKQVFKGDNDE